ncbi:MAG: biotin transport system substrate-specific component [Paracoccaceae bacterium]|jgi:biotin transport system substrate-specific component
MALGMTDTVLSEEIWPAEGSALWVKRVVLVVLGIAVLAISAKIKVPMWPSPVPITMGTFAVLTIGAAYGPRLGLTTIVGYLLIGMLGYDVFANSTADANGLTYMMGGTGGYLVGFVLATLALGYAARLGWDRNVFQLAGVMFVGNVLIYIPGILWLAHLYTWEKPILEWGLTPFLIGDGFKLVLAALLVPAVWKLVGKARG